MRCANLSREATGWLRCSNRVTVSAFDAMA
jgi:hypothetical protein